ncbi:uncharacterized protein LOC127359601 isoform X5 [Dicentrarchus labrax]|uniref:Endonuclease domain-containing 1 protein n=1 Tax=Dicentrarchus labrax TaxID=13489 RepID=A0A8C4GJR3_DICLA|nr:uncharacterized protein LOC127359601 isoform X5 [Dicentrarchus labrax]
MEKEKNTKPYNNQARLIDYAPGNEDESKDMENDNGELQTQEARKADTKEYNKGHLFPNSHAYDNYGKKSTFTLTNIVPQVISFNQGSWNKMETCIKCIMDTYCKDNNGKTKAFVVVGAKPGEKDNHNGRVNIPSKLWFAFCCFSAESNAWIASALWGDNVAEDNKQHMQTRTLKELRESLKIDAFPKSKCPDTTLVKFDPA